MARLDAAEPLPVAASSVPVSPSSQLVENLGSLVAHCLRINSTVTLCGWDTARALISASHPGSCPLASVEDHPWWKICDRCLPTEREVARLAAVEDECCDSD